MTGPRRSLRLLFLGLAAGAAFALSPPGHAGAAEGSCEKGTVTGVLEIGDGSTPPCEFVDLWAVPDSGTWTSIGQFKWGAVTAELPAGTWRFAAHACDTYFPFRPSEPVVCAKGSDGCVGCQGRFKLAMFGLFGGFSGQVTLLPSNVPAGPGVPVGAASGQSCSAEKFAYTDAKGAFVLAPSIEPHRANHWGVAVDGDGSGPGSRAYLLTADSCENGVTATTFSSRDVTVNLYRAAPYMALHDASVRPLPYPPLLPVLPPGEVAPGVSPTTGNAFLDQTDIQAWGAAGRLTFVRSYNSRAAASRVESALGPGWSFSYDAQLSWPETRVIMARDDDGRVTYFEDSDGDGTYRPSVPLSERSRVVKTATGYERRFFDGGRDVFNAAGRLLERVDAGGRTTRLARDAAGRLATVTDPDGRKLAFAYSAAGRLLKLSMGTDDLVTYAYDATQRLEHVTYPDASGFSFAYDVAGQLLGVTDAAGRTLRAYTYEGQKVRRFELADAQERTTIEYTPQKTTVTDALGRVTSYEWANVRGLHLVTAVVGVCPACAGARVGVTVLPAPPTPPLRTDGDASSPWDRLLTPPWPLEKWPRAAVDIAPHPGAVADRHAWTYDEAGRVLSYTDGSGRRSVLTYDEHGEPSSITQAASATVRISRDAAGRITALRTASTVDAKQERATLLGYDEKGRLASRTESGFAPDGRPVRLTVRLGYDEAGHLARLEGPRSTAEAVTFAYDLAGNLTAMSDALGLVRRFSGHTPLGYPTSVVSAGRTTSYTYGQLGRILARGDGAEPTMYAYSPTGRLKLEQQPRGNRTEYVYDAYDRLTEERHGPQRLLHRYDRAGQRTEDVVPGESVAERDRSLEYDAFGRLVRIAVPQGSHYEIVYDKLGRPEMARGPGTLAASLQYDENGRLATVKRTGGTVVAYAYDAAGRVISATDGNGTGYAYGYDDLGQLRLLATPAGDRTAFDYDAAGQLIGRLDGRGIATGYDYDARGRLLRVRYPKDKAIEYSYDNCPEGRDRLCAVVDGAGRTSFAYDSRGRLAMEAREMSGGGRFQTGYSYDANGNLAAIRYPSGRLVSYAWDEADHVRSISTASQDAPLAVLANLSHDAHGLVGGIAYSNGLSVKWARDLEGRVRAIRGGPLDLGYVYDAAGNVITQSSADRLQTFEYDGAQRLITANGPWGALGWSYDGSGNRLSESTTSGNTAYAYQPRTHRLSSTNTDRPFTFGYDGAGNTTRLGESRTGYDEAGRLIWFGQETRTGEYAYDYKGRRVSKKTVDGTNYFVYDLADHLIAETTPEGVTRAEYAYADDRPIAYFRAGLSFVHTDAAGVPVLLTGLRGETLWERQPRPFGDEPAPAHAGATTLNLRAPGQYYDRETGFYQNGRRTYVPKLGRYLEPNPCAAPDPLAANVYSYAAGNPNAFVVPEGGTPRPAETSWMRALWAEVLRWPPVVSPTCSLP
jgi:RHS repeat-associated protein